MGGLGGVVSDGHRVIQIHPDFLDDHLLLGLEILGPEARAKDVGQDVEGFGEVFGKAGDMVEGVFFGSLGVVLGADPVEVLVDGQGIAVRRPLENHVFEEMRDPRQLGRLVTTARLDEESRGNRPRLVVDLGDDLKAVIEDGVMESQGRTLETD